MVSGIWKLTALNGRHSPGRMDHPNPDGPQWFVDSAADVHQPAFLTPRAEVKSLVCRGRLGFPGRRLLENTDQVLLEVGSTTQAREFEFWALRLHPSETVRVRLN